MRLIVCVALLSLICFLGSAQQTGGSAVHGTAGGIPYRCNNAAQAEGLSSPYAHDPIAEACASDAETAAHAGQSGAAEEFWRRSCSRGFVTGCVGLSRLLARTGRLDEAASMLAAPNGPCRRAPYTAALSGYEGKVCDIELLTFLKTDGEKQALRGRLCAQGHETRFCTSPLGVRRAGSQVEFDRAITATRLREQAAEEAAQIHTAGAGQPVGGATDDWGCRVDSTARPSWTPVRYVQVSAALAIGCAVTEEDPCSRQQTVELWVWNHDSQAVDASITWSLEANVLVKAKKLVVAGIQPGEQRIASSTLLDFRDPSVIVRARASRCDFDNFRVGAAGGSPKEDSPQRKPLFIPLPKLQKAGDDLKGSDVR